MSTDRRMLVGRLLRGGVAFTLTSVVQRGLVLVLLPVYARALSPTDYGSIALLLTVTGLLAVLLSFGLEAAVFRTCARLANDADARTRFVKTVGLFLLVAPTVTVLVVAPLALGPVARLAALSAPQALAVVLTASLQVSATVLPMGLWRADGRFGAYLALGALHALVNHGLLLLLVVGAGRGVDGWVAAGLVASLAVLPVSVALLVRKGRGALEWRLLRDALAYGVPLVPHALAHWSLALSDRLVLAAHRDLATVGVYTVAYQVGAGFGMLLAEMNRTVLGEYGRALAGERQAASLRGIATCQLLLTGFLGLAAALLLPPLLDVALPAAYAGAGRLVPWIIAGYVVFGLYYVPMNGVAVLAGDTRWVWGATVVAALVNVGLNLALVPRWGVTAAAVDTVVGYLVLLAGTSLYARWRHGTIVPFDRGRVASGFALMGLAYAVAAVAGPTEPASALAARALWVCAVGAVVALAIAPVAGGAGAILQRVRR